MTQYVLQIINADNVLIKCFEVTAEEPIPVSWPSERTQIVITDTQLFDDAVAFYNINTTNAEYFWDGTNLTWQLRS